MIKSHKGRIAVYTESHDLIDSMLYYTSEGMKRVLDIFMKYTEAGYITVRPYEDEPKVKNVYRIPVLTGDVKEKIVRPKAEYTNLKSGYYANQKG